MPRIQVNVNGQPFRIDTFNKDTISAWFRDITAYMPGNSSDYITVQVWPMLVPGPVPAGLQGLDWPNFGPQNGRVYELTQAGVDQFAADLRAVLEGET